MDGLFVGLDVGAFVRIVYPLNSGTTPDRDASWVLFFAAAVDLTELTKFPPSDISFLRSDVVSLYIFAAISSRSQIIHSSLNMAT